MGPRLQLILAIICMVDLTMSANILVVMPLPLYSHTNNFLPIFKELAARGHNVTMVSPFPQKKPVPNFNEIIVPDITDAMFSGIGTRNLLDLDGIFFDLFGLWFFGTTVPPLVLETEPLQRLIKDTDSKFDLVITETWFIQEMFIAFGHKFNAPVINIAPTFIPPVAAYLTGNNLPISYIPVGLLPYTDRMCYTQRLWNSFYYYWNVLFGNLIYLRKQDASMRKYFVYPGSENIPPLIDMLRNTSLTLMDSNFAVNYPAPFQKNVVEFGGININKAEKLPADLQKFMDSATEGAVYFSFGSHMNFSLIKPEMQKAVVTAFGKLKQKVLMKMELGNPHAELAKPNTLVKRWFPQASILAHPNCKLFVTHGGGHGSMEGAYNAVPMVVIPLMGDQKFNAKFIESRGMGKIIKVNELSEEKLLSTINLVLNDPSYRQKVQERSAIFKDTPINILDNVIYWIEYVIRHKGAPHLRPAAVDLYWFQYFLLDVIAFYVFILALILILLKLILKSVFSFLKWLIKGKDKSKTSKKKKE